MLYSLLRLLLGLLLIGVSGPAFAQAPGSSSLPPSAPKPLTSPDQNPSAEGETQAIPSAAAPSSEGDAEGGIVYQAIDASTLRVFAIGDVDTEELVSRDGTIRITIAIPHAGHGTGFVVGDDGLILTAAHVVDGANHVVVRLPGKRGFTVARVVYQDSKTDVAVLSILRKQSGITLPTEKSIAIRQSVFALGYPLDPSRTQAQSSRGIIAGAFDNGRVQLDINVNPGNSGGPLVDENNNLLGMVVAGGNTKAGVAGLGIALPIAELRRAIEEAKKRIAKVPLRPISAEEIQNAAAIDTLIQDRAIHVVEEWEDLNQAMDRKRLERSLSKFTAKVSSPDVLTYIAGNLWNAHLALKYSDKEEKVAGKTLTSKSRSELSKRFRRKAIRLVERAITLDSSIVDRSEFADWIDNKGSVGDQVWPSLAQGSTSTSDSELSRIYAIARADVSLYHERNTDFGPGYILSLLGAYPLYQTSDDRKLDLLGGLSYGENTEGLGHTSFHSDYTSETTHTLRHWSAELGLLYRTQVRATAQSHTKSVLSLELAWTPGYTKHFTLQEIDFDQNFGEPEVGNRYRRFRKSGIDWKQLRLGVGLGWQNFSLNFGLRRMTAQRGIRSAVLVSSGFDARF